MNKDNKFQWWNPLRWFDMIVQAVGAIFRGILELFGIFSDPPPMQHENIQVADVESAEKTAREQQAAIDHFNREMTPAQIVHVYCRATEADRKVMDLSKLSVEQQDWLLRLSDGDLVMLGASGEAACGRSVKALKVMVSKREMKAAEIEKAPEILSTPEPMTEDEKWEFIRERYNELLYSLSVANPNPKFTPSDRPTVH
ncbi:hypothetical protein [Sinorhizobium fredii]|uniref:hypothetical protein n=1 Tax=Rhizobium fredii TaxID=380 RepID=UPI001294F14E|nr:hypothetical protein [Sinorhizobium fredii]MQW99614.1 hypothetical protein [Sinorhizobium fredii]